MRRRSQLLSYTHTCARSISCSKREHTLQMSGFTLFRSHCMTGEPREQRRRRRRRGGSVATTTTTSESVFWQRSLALSSRRSPVAAPPTKEEERERLEVHTHSFSPLLRPSNSRCRQRHSAAVSGEAALRTDKTTTEAARGGAPPSATCSCTQNGKAN